MTSIRIAEPDLGSEGHTDTKFHPLKNSFQLRSGIKIHSLAHEEKYNPH